MANPKLTEEQVTEILAARLYEKPRPSCAELSRRFQMSSDAIFKICARLSWQHVPIPEPPDGQDPSIDPLNSNAQKV